MAFSTFCGCVARTVTALPAIGIPRSPRRSWRGAPRAFAKSIILRVGALRSLVGAIAWTAGMWLQVSRAIDAPDLDRG
jgi:hypothetical protein